MKTLNHLLANVQFLPKMLATSAIALSLIACGGGTYVEEAETPEVITLGDSIFDLSGDIQAFLHEYSGTTFRDYTLSGAELSGGSLATPVVQQYADAKSTDANIKTIVMNGGGNDILIPAIALDPYRCRTYWWRSDISSRCKNLVNDTYVEGVDLLNTMQRDGVQNVIYSGYYYTKGLQSNLAKAVDYGNFMLNEACKNTTASCQFVDPRGVINSSDIIVDGIHPSTSGSKKIANLIWPVLEPLL